MNFLFKRILNNSSLITNLYMYKQPDKQAKRAPNNNISGTKTTTKINMNPINMTLKKEISNVVESLDGLDTIIFGRYDYVLCM